MPGDSYEQLSHPVTQKTGIKPSAIEQVLRDVHCPACQYNLRGLIGNQVQCPECGESCDITKLVTMQWTKPWFKAPYYNTLTIPLIICIISWMFIPILMTGMPVPSSLASMEMVPLFCFLGWICSFYLAYRVLKSFRGVLLSLLLHVAFAGYIGGAITFAMCLILFISDLNTANSQAQWLMFYVVMMILSVVAIWLARKAEKFVAQQCINRYLSRIRGTE